MNTILVIANPKSGRNRGLSTANLVSEFLSSQGVAVRLEMTEFAGHATQISADSCSSFDAVFVVGGDGTVSEVARGILQAKSVVPLGIIPVGTANVVARELGIPCASPLKAARSLLLSSPRGFDIALCNDRPFLANVGVGFDADVVVAIDRFRQTLAPTKRFKMLHYIPIGYSVLRGHRPHQVEVRIDDVAIEGTFADVIVCNTRNYGGVMSMTPDARADDGILDVYLSRRKSRLGILHQLFLGLTRRKSRGSAVYLQCKRIQIYTSVSSAVQIDGDPSGGTPLDVRIRSTGFRILAP